MYNDLYAKMLKNFSAEKYIGHFDFDRIIESSHQNAKAFSDAMKASTESARAIICYQAELLQKQAEETSRIFHNLDPSKETKAAIEQLTKSAKSNTKSAIADSKEIFGIISKSGSDAAETISKKLSAIIAESNDDVFSNTKNEGNKK